MCRIAMSRDFFERFLPKPELSNGADDGFPPAGAPLLDEDDDDEGDPRSSRFGGASRLRFTTLSTILLPISTGLIPSSSPPLTLERFLTFIAERVAAVPLGTGIRPREGEQDWRRPRGTPAPGMEPPVSTEAERETPGLPREAELGLSGRVVRKFGGTSRENPGISDGFHGLDLRVGDSLRTSEGDMPFFPVTGAGPVDLDVDVPVTATAEEEDDDEDVEEGTDVLIGMPVKAAPADALRVGVEDLAGRKGLPLLPLLGTDDDNDDERLVGVEDLRAASPVTIVAMGFVEELVVKRDVGVEDRAGLETADCVRRPVGVEGLAEPGPGPPDEEGRRIPPGPMPMPEEPIPCLETALARAASSCGSASCINRLNGYHHHGLQQSVKLTSSKAKQNS